MAFSFGYNDRVDDIRSPDRHVSGDESLFTAFTSPTNNENMVRSPNDQLNDSRGSLHRRFTTTTLPTMSGLSHLGQQRRQATEFSAPDLAFKMNTAKLVEKKQAEYELMKKNRQKLQEEMSLLEMRAKREEDDMRRIQSDLAQFSNGYGRQSEPTTPPDYADNGFPTVLSRPNRFSTSSITSPPGLSNRTSRAGSFVTSPPSERARAYQALTGPAPQSQPDTRRNSDGEDDEFEESILDVNHRSAASLNRNSMPVNFGGKRNGAIQSLSNALGPVNTSTFLFGPDADEFDKPEKPATNRLSSYYQMNTTADNFPILVTRDSDAQGRQTDLPTAQEQEPSDFHSDGWPKSYARNSYHSGMKLGQASEQPQPTGDSPPFGLPHPNSSGQSTPQKSASNNRHSMGPKIGMSSEGNRASLVTNTPPNGLTGAVAPTPPKLQSSYSTNDIPTMKTTGPSSSSAFVANASTAEQRLHNHNVSLGRIPPNANVANRQSRDLTSSDGKLADQLDSFHSPPLSLQANMSPFGLEATPSLPTTEASQLSTPSHPNLSSPPPHHSYSGGHGLHNSMQNNVPNSMQMLNTSMGALQFGNPVQMYQQQYPGYSPYQNFNHGRLVDSQARVIQSRRNQNGEENARYTNISLESLKGEIYSLCKDQHGCRFLQKRLEEHKPENVQMIFEETKEHMIELMTDPFGNYLCQKLLEFANDDQRTALINNAAPHMVKIALNQHGTRALQKMIEFVSTPTQIQTVIFALKDQVVTMIQDLNGNHVIQKCLNRLSAEDAQFIFDAVALNCVVVGTHRHGCCVIQRCIDHASGEQKAQLVAAITKCSFPLVQDPFGNYVLQYIFDQGEESFSQPLCETFLGNLGMLSKQKFSSNVIEKCIRIASHDIKTAMVNEIVTSTEFERMADDNYANYVVQTAWDYADADDQARMADRLRPLLPRIKHKPYGRRLQTRVHDHDRKLGISTSGTMTPTDISSPESYPVGPATVGASMHPQMPPNSAFQNPSNHFNGLQNMSSFGMPSMVPPPSTMGYGQQLHRMNNPPMPNMGQFQRQGHYPQQQQQQQQPHPPFHGYGRGPQNGMGYY